MILRLKDMHPDEVCVASKKMTCLKFHLLYTRQFYSFRWLAFVNDVGPLFAANRMSNFIHEILHFEFSENVSFLEKLEKL